jgi:hypothetical protein
MSDNEVNPPPEDPDTEADETLSEDPSPEERTRDASEHAGKTARDEQEHDDA